MNIVFTDNRPEIDKPIYTELLSWRERVTMLRLRRGWTKADLATRVGCSRTTLWRTIECASDHERWQPLPDELKVRIEAALGMNAEESAA